MHFTHPLALVLLICLPLLALVGWPRRGMNFGRESASLIIRLVLCLMVVLALAGLEIVQRGDKLAVVFLLDVSDSVSPARQEAGLAYMRTSLETIGADDRAGLVVFGGEALVELPLSTKLTLEEIRSRPAAGHTDLEEAIRLGLALLPEDSAQRLVILSDGLQTTGNAEKAALLAAAMDVDIQTLQFPGDAAVDAAIIDLRAPDYLRQGERFTLEITIQSSASGPAVLRVLSGAELLGENEIGLEAGLQTFSLPLTAQQTGFNTLRVEIIPAQDSQAQNNAMAAYSFVQGPPRVLIIAPPSGEELPFTAEPRPEEATQLTSALQAGGFVVENLHPAALPSNLPTLAGYDAIVLVDVPASQLSSRQMTALQTYVRDLGGGLTAIGGPTSFGVGGYFQTPLEELLPVEMVIKDETRRPTITMVFVIDRSGSMSETSGGAQKLQLAKEAAIQSIQLLFPSDRVGVIAFDESASWIWPISDVAGKEEAIAAISRISIGGGTDILAGVQAVSRVLPDDTAQIKHIILLTDGGADPSGIPELVQQMHLDSGITLSSIAIGRDAAPFLKGLAESGGGRYHFVANPNSLPQIFTQETTLATRSYIIEGEFFPTLAAASPVLAGINATPPLYGYIGTTSKPAAQTILRTPERDPLLAIWQYGLGRAAAFTSDATSRWARDWVSWQGFPTFWSQVISATFGERRNPNLEVQVVQEGEQAEVIVDALQPDGSFLNDRQFQATITFPAGGQTVVELRQTAPGRYAAQFSPGEEGAYLVAVSGTAPQGASDPSGLSTVAGWSQTYSAEYRPVKDQSSILANLIEISGGKPVSENPGDVFLHNLPAPRARQATWPWLLAAAAGLLPIDIAIRRLQINRAEILQNLQKVVHWKRQPAQKPIEQNANVRLQKLKAVKQRVASRADSGPKPGNQESPPKPAGEVSEKPKAGQATKIPEQDRDAAEKSTREHLLEKKRRSKSSD